MANPPQGTSSSIVRRYVVWWQPDFDDVDGPLPPPSTATTATVAQQAALWPDPSGQQDRSNAARWYGEDAEYRFPVAAAGNFPFTNNAQFPQPFHAVVSWTDPSGGAAPLASIALYRAAEFGSFASAVFLGNVLPGVQTFDDYFGDLADYPASLTGLRYFAIATNTLGIAGSLSSFVNVDFAGDNFAAGVFYDAQPFVSNAQRWYQPDTDDIDGPLPPPAANAYDPSVMAGAWQEQPQDPTTAQRWFQRDDATESQLPPSTVVVPTTDQLAGLFGWDAQGDRSLQPVWFQPDTEVIGAPTGTVTTATIAQQAGLWQDPSAQQDRSLQPRWFVPPDPTEALYPTLPVPPFIVGAGFPWTLPDEYPWRRDFTPDAIEAQFAGTLQPWLFTVGSPSTGTGAAPAVLIDAEDGDVYLYIGGNFIVRAQ